MSADRSVLLSPRLQAGKAAFRELVDAFGGQVAAAAETGKSQSRISAYGLRNTDDFAPVDVVLRLEQSTHGSHNHPQVTRWLARQTGFALVPLPDPDAAFARVSSSPLAQSGCVRNWGLLASRLAKDAGDVTSGICADLADDHDVSPTEARGRLNDAGALVRVAVELEHALRVRALERES